ncbi:hypothetical protein, partial [Bacillus wiedmannii]|uniref:hypothetical protein n=1 Tax=Bacillus wiedmannii TaxID=1890302 RepID=UPI001484D698
LEPGRSEVGYNIISEGSTSQEPRSIVWKNVKNPILASFSGTQDNLSWQVLLAPELQNYTYSDGTIGGKLELPTYGSRADFVTFTAVPNGYRYVLGGKNSPIVNFNHIASVNDTKILDFNWDTKSYARR